MKPFKLLVKTTMRGSMLILIYLSLFLLISGCNNDKSPDNSQNLTQTVENAHDTEGKPSTGITNKPSKQLPPRPSLTATPEALKTNDVNQSTRAEVAEVLEGNLIKVIANGNIPLIIKYIGVDVPAEPIDINLAAKEMNKFLVQDKIVLLEKDKALPDDESEIKLRHVFVQGEYVNVKLLSSGLARMSDDLNLHAHKEKLTKASEEAQNLNLGIWRTISGQENDEKADKSSYPKLGCGTLPCQKK